MFQGSWAEIKGAKKKIEKRKKNKLETKTINSQSIDPTSQHPKPN
jgi:hypothetical protein